MVSRLSGMEAVSLHTESSTVPAHAVALIIIEASDQLSHQRLRELVGSALPQLARFRCRLVGKPLGLGQPVWAEIDDYDPTSQIHSATVPAPGGRREFAELIAWLTTGALDRHKPLWEAWSIDGLEGGRWALAVKVSPAVSDGVAGAASIWPRLVPTGPRVDPTSNLPPEPSLGTPPSIGELVTDTATELLENYVTGVRLIAGAVPGVLRAAGRRLRGMGEPDQLPQAAASMRGPCPGEVCFEFGDHGQGGEQQPADRVGRVVHGPADVELDTGGGEFVDDVAGVGEGAGEAVELGDDEGVAAAARGERFAQPGSVAVGAGQAVVDVDAFRVDAECGERVTLRSEVLIDCRYSGVADLEFCHRASMPVSPPSPGRFTEPVLRDARLCIPVGRGCCD